MSQASVPTSDQPPAWQQRQAWLFVGGVLTWITATALAVLILAVGGPLWEAALPFLLPVFFLACLLIDHRRSGKLRARNLSNIWELINGRALAETVAIGPEAPTVVRSRSEAIFFLLSGPTVLLLAIPFAFASVRVMDIGPAGYFVGVFVLGAAILASGIGFLYFERRRAPGEDWASVHERGRHEAWALIRTRRLSA